MNEELTNVKEEMETMKMGSSCTVSSAASTSSDWDRALLPDPTPPPSPSKENREPRTIEMVIARLDRVQ